VNQVVLYNYIGLLEWTHDWALDVNQCQTAGVWRGLNADSSGCSRLAAGLTKATHIWEPLIRRRRPLHLRVLPLRCHQPSARQQTTQSWHRPAGPTMYMYAQDSSPTRDNSFICGLVLKLPQLQHNATFNLHLRKSQDALMHCLHLH